MIYSQNRENFENDELENIKNIYFLTSNHVVIDDHFEANKFLGYYH